MSLRSSGLRLLHTVNLRAILADHHRKSAAQNPALLSCGHEQNLTAISCRWHAFTSNWREITSYNSRFYLDVSVGFTCKQAYARAADQNGRI